MERVYSDGMTISGMYATNMLKMHLQEEFFFWFV